MNTPAYKRIGILGGMSPESTAAFYELLIKKHLDTYHTDAYPEIVIFSVNFDRVLQHQDALDTKPYVAELSHGLHALTQTGVDVVVIASNTVHKVLGELRAISSVPILSIVDATLDQATKQGLHKLLLLGTKQTMSGTFYQKEAAKRNINIIVPSDSEQTIINTIIFDELVIGNVPSDTSKQQLPEIISRQQGFDAVILGCTELQMILTPTDISFPLLDTLEIHVQATLEFATIPTS